MEKLALLISCYSALSEEDTLDGGGKLLKACNILEDGNLKKKLYMTGGREQHFSVNSFSK